MDGWLYAVGGNDGSSSLNSIEKYNPRSNKWVAASCMFTRRSSVGVAVLELLNFPPPSSPTLSVSSTSLWHGVTAWLTSASAATAQTGSGKRRNCSVWDRKEKGGSGQVNGWRRETRKREGVDKAPGLVNIQYPPELVALLVKIGQPWFKKTLQHKSWALISKYRHFFEKVVNVECICLFYGQTNLDALYQVCRWFWTALYLVWMPETSLYSSAIQIPAPTLFKSIKMFPDEDVLTLTGLSSSLTFFPTTPVFDTLIVKCGGQLILSCVM